MLKKLKKFNIKKEIKDTEKNSLSYPPESSDSVKIIIPKHKLTLTLTFSFPKK